MSARVFMVTGSRKESVVHDVLEALDYYMPTVVVVGCCPTGADRAARLWCGRRNIPCPVLIAAWKRHGKSAGPKRNAALVRVAALLDAQVLAFPRGRSHGTRDCMRKAEAAGLTVTEQ